MSVRYLYRTLPASKRVCSFWACRGQILRNLAKTEDGRLWHYGCLQTAKDQQFKCAECSSTLDGTEVTFAEYGDGRPTLGCGKCGATIKTPTDVRAVMKIGNL